MKNLTVLLLAMLVLFSSVAFSEEPGKARILTIPYTENHAPVNSNEHFSAHVIYQKVVVNSRSMPHDAGMTFEDYAAQYYPTYTSFDVIKSIELEDMVVDCASVDFDFRGEIYTVLMAFCIDGESDCLMIIDCPEDMRPELEASLDEIYLSPAIVVE